MTVISRRTRRLAAGLLMAATMLAGTVTAPAVAQAAFTTLDRSSESRVMFSGAERGQPIYAGGKAQVSGMGFRPGQQVTLLYGTTPIQGGALVADADGKLAGSIDIPANAEPGVHPVVVVAKAPYRATVADLKISPVIALSGQAGYTVTEAPAARGLFQSAYSAKNNALFVTSAVGHRPPVQQSELARLGGDTLKVEKRITPAADGSAGGVYATYGVGVDDGRDTVWTTNTPHSTVAVYRQSDLGLVKQFAPGTVPHARDVVVDQATGKAFVSSMTNPDVYVFDTATLGAPHKITIQTGRRGEKFSAASLSLDPKSNILYVVSQSTNEVALINPATEKVEKLLPVPGAKGAIGVSSDPATGRIYVVAQGSDNLVVLDGRDGRLIADTPVGAGALNVVFDPLSRQAYIANRGAGTIAVADADGRLVANLGPAPLVNHVAVGKNGTIYAVDKSAAARDAETDTVLKIRRR